MIGHLRRMTLVLIVCIGASAGLVSCSHGASNAHVALPAKNEASWVLPLDQYMPRNWDPEAAAERALAQPCMARAGSSWNPPTETVDPATGESWNDAGRKLFSVALAKKYGYGNSPTTIVPASETAAELAFMKQTNSLSAGDAEQLDKCFRKADKRIGLQSDPTLYAQSLRGNAQPLKSDENKVEAAAKRWVACMKPIGVAGLPASPTDMPPHSFSETDTDSPTDNVASRAERELAVADAKCQQSSGWHKAQYLAEWNSEVPLLRKNADTLKRYDRIAQKQRAEALKIIAAHPLRNG